MVQSESALTSRPASPEGICAKSAFISTTATGAKKKKERRKKGTDADAGIWIILHHRHTTTEAGRRGWKKLWELKFCKASLLCYAEAYHESGRPRFRCSEEKLIKAGMGLHSMTKDIHLSHFLHFFFFFQMASFSFLLSAHQGRATQAECLSFACIISWTTLSPCCTDSIVYVSCPLRHVNHPSSPSTPSLPFSFATQRAQTSSRSLYTQTLRHPTPHPPKHRNSVRHILHLSDQHIPLKNTWHILTTQLRSVSMAGSIMVVQRQFRGIMLMQRC